MEQDNTERLAGEGMVESYWIARKRAREEKTREDDKQALEVLELACKFYKDKYPKSDFGVTYSDDKATLPKPSLEVSREDALKFRAVLEYFKSENQSNMTNSAHVGRAVWRINQCIPDISKLNKIIALEKEKQNIDREIHRLKTMKEEIAKPPEPVKPFVCNYCKKEFEGPTARQDIQNHIFICMERPDKAPTEIEVVEEKLFTCQVCGIQLNRFDMKEHARRCRAKPEPIEVDELTCPECGKKCANKGALTNHLKTHKE